MISKRNLVTAIILVLVILGIGFLIYKTEKLDTYSVVYLTTGEVYVGKLNTFPEMRLSNGYILQVTKDATDPTKNNFQLQSIDEALWAPKYLNINRKNVVFYGPLAGTSKIAQTLAGQKPRP